jgi:hypothetical protein
MISLFKTSAVVISLIAAAAFGPTMAAAQDNVPFIEYDQSDAPKGMQDVRLGKSTVRVIALHEGYLSAVEWEMTYYSTPDSVGLPLTRRHSSLDMCLEYAFAQIDTLVKAHKRAFTNLIYANCVSIY